MGPQPDVEVLALDVPGRLCVVVRHYPFPDAPGIPMVPYLTEADKNRGSGGKSILSCLLPGQLDGTCTGSPASFATSYPADLQHSVLQAWTDYGFPA